MYCKALDTGCSNCAHQTGYQISVSYNDDGTPLILFGHYQNGLTAVRREGNGWMARVVTPQTGEPRDINQHRPARVPGVPHRRQHLRRPPHHRRRRDLEARRPRSTPPTRWAAATSSTTTTPT